MVYFLFCFWLIYLHSIQIASLFLIVDCISFFFTSPYSLHLLHYSRPFSPPLLFSTKYSLIPLFFILLSPYSLFSALSVFLSIASCFAPSRFWCSSNYHYPSHHHHHHPHNYHYLYHTINTTTKQETTCNKQTNKKTKKRDYRSKKIFSSLFLATPSPSFLTQ